VILGGEAAGLWGTRLQEMVPNDFFESGTDFGCKINRLGNGARSAKSDICATSVQKRAIPTLSEALCH
jgi:hypothetical protein